MSNINSSFVSSTFWTERIGFTAGLKTLEVFDQVKPWEHVTELGNYLRKCWSELAHHHKLEVGITGIPAMSSFSFSKDRNLVFKTYITQELLKVGILGSTTVYLSTSHNKETIDTYIDRLNTIFKFLAQADNVSVVKSKLETDVCRDGFKRLN